MNINFIDNENNSKPFYMGCYGIGVSRVLGLIYENNAIKENDKVVGVSLPLSVTPYYLYIISNDKKKESAEAISFAAADECFRKFLFFIDLRFIDVGLVEFSHLLAVKYELAFFNTVAITTDEHTQEWIW